MTRLVAEDIRTAVVTGGLGFRVERDLRGALRTTTCCTAQVITVT